MEHIAYRRQFQEDIQTLTNIQHSRSYKIFLNVIVKGIRVYLMDACRAASNMSGKLKL